MRYCLRRTYRWLTLGLLLLLTFPWVFPSILLNWAQPALESLCTQSHLGLRCHVDASEMTWAGWRHPLSLRMNRLTLFHSLGKVLLQDLTFRISLLSYFRKDSVITRFSVRQARIEADFLFPEPLTLDNIQGDWSAHLSHLRFHLHESRGYLRLTQNEPFLIVQGVLENMDLSQLSKRWPLPLAPKPRAWVLRNLPKGLVDYADIQLKAEWNFDIFKLLDVHGEIKGHGIEVNYLGKLPPIEDTQGHVHYTQQDFFIDATGQAGDIQVSQAKIHISELDKKDQFIHLDLTVRAPLSSALRLMSLKPLEFAQKLNLNPRRVAGQTETQLKLDFPLEEDTTLKDVDIQAQSLLTQLHLKTDFMLNDQPVTLDAEILELSLNRNQFTLNGLAKIAGHAGKIQWHEFFKDSSPLARQYIFEGHIQPEKIPVLQGMMTGLIPLHVRYEKNQKAEEICHIRGNLKTASLDFLSWQKPINEPAAFQTILHLNENGWWLESFDLHSNHGRLKLTGAPDGEITINPSYLGKSRFSGQARLLKDTPVSIQLHARTLDLETYFQKSFSSTEALSKNQLSLGLTLEADEIVLSSQALLKQAKGSFFWQHGLLKEGFFHALTKQEQPIHFHLKPVNATKQNFVFEAREAGDILELLSTGYDLQGGSLRIQGEKIDERDNYKAIGHVELKKITVLKAPFLSRLLGALSLQGLLNLLTGQGLTFDEGMGFFELSPQILKFQEFRIANDALGLTFKGLAHYESRTVNFEGELFPFYFINRTLANIPLLGKSLSGGSPDGIFAATFLINGAMDNPTISVNPLATVTPGILRRAFSTLE